MNPSTRWERITLTTVMLVFALASGKGLAANWKHQSMAWVFGPDGTSIRSPDPEISGAQPAGFTWSMVPGNVGAVYFAGGNQITDRITQEFTDLNATGLNSFADYKNVLESAVDAWADVSGIQNLGYVEETGEVMVGAVDEIVNRGASAGVGHIRFLAYDSPIIPTNVFASTSYIPEPGATVDNAYNRSRSLDVRFRSDAHIWSSGNQLNENGFYFKKIAMHELGHAFGFGHNSISDSVMGGGLYTEPGLGTGDIEGAIAIYGVPEPATVLALVVGGLCLFSCTRLSDSRRCSR